MIEGAGGGHPAARSKFALKNGVESGSQAAKPPAASDGRLNAPDTGPFLSYSQVNRANAASGGAAIASTPPPSATPEQIGRLAELGISVSDQESLSAPVAHNAIDYLGSDERLGTGFLAESWTAADLEEGVGLLQDMSRIGVELGSSSFEAGRWSLEEIRQVHGVVDSMAAGAEREFLATHSREELVRLAAYYGLPPEQAGDAAFVLAIGSITRESDAEAPRRHPLELLRDAGSNVNYVRGENGTLTTGEAVWYARADGRRLTLGDRTFFEGEQQSPTRNGLSFTTESLIAHEIGHYVVARRAGFGAEFDLLADGVSDDDSRGSYRMRDGSSVELATNSSGYSFAPRSSEAGDEEAADLVTNGLLGGFTEDEAGRARAEQFAIILARLFADELESVLPSGYEAPPGYAAAAGAPITGAALLSRPVLLVD